MPAMHADILHLLLSRHLVESVPSVDDEKHT